MTDVDEYHTRTAALLQQFRDVHGIKARDLAAAARKSRRELPKALRQSAEKIAAAGEMIGHPKLEPMVDFADLRARYDELSEHLDQVDVAYIKRGRRLAMAGRLVFNLILIVAVFVAWMVWSGHL